MHGSRPKCLSKNLNLQATRPYKTKGGRSSFGVGKILESMKN